MSTRTQLFLKGQSITMLVQGLPLRQPDGSVKYARLRVATGETIEADRWDVEAQRPNASYSAADAFRLFSKLSGLVSKMDAASAQARTEGNPTPERIREIFEELNGSVKQVPPMERKDMRLVEVIEELEQGADSPLTKKGYRNLKNKVEAFDQKVKVSALSDGWRSRFYGSFSNNLRESSMWGMQKHLNAAINHARAKKLSITIDTEHRFTCEQKKEDVLDWSDLAKVIAFKPKSKHPEKIRRQHEIVTLMLAMALTSCRVSDLWSCLGSIAERNGVRCASFTTKKKCGTKHPLVMPLILRPLSDRLAKYGTPPPRSEQSIREGIKEVLRELGIRKGEQSCHSMRRAFITNMLSLGVISEILLAKVFTGHQLGAGELKVLAGYDQGSTTAKQKLVIKILAGVDPSETAGIRLV